MQLFRLKLVPSTLAVSPGFKANFAKFLSFGIPAVVGRLYLGYSAAWDRSVKCFGFASFLDVDSATAVSLIGSASFLRYIWKIIA